ncbi:MAG: cytochrome c [Gallionella sp.]|nr:cytochrome c [Gallionella sp.]
MAANDNELWWASESFWKKTTIWTTVVMLFVLVGLTLDTVSQIQVGGKRVLAYSTINNRVDYKFDETLKRQVVVIGQEEPLFGKKLTEQEAEALVDHGKLTMHAKNCMDCHTILGNGAYYAPDLTKAWLDPFWGSRGVREDLMVAFIKDPSDKVHNSLGRRMPKLGVTDEEAHAVVAYLKWMSTIDTNGFPNNFKPIDQEN